MSGHFVDGFDYLTSSVSASEALTIFSRAGWTNISISGVRFSTDVGRFNYGRSCFFQAESGFSKATGYFGFVRPILTSVSTGFIAAALWRSNTDTTTGGAGIGFYNTSTGLQLFIYMSAWGVIKVIRGDGTLLGQSDPNAFYNQTWFNLEVKATIDNTSGEVEVRLDGKTIIHLVSVDTQNGAINEYDAICIGGYNPVIPDNPGGYIDDFASWDTTGTVNNDWLGTNRVKTQFMIADGSNIDSTIGGTSPAATHWESVNNYDLDDVKYVYFSTVGDYDLYDVDPVVSAPIVHMVQIRVGARQDDATQLTMRTLVKSGATTEEGPDEPLSQTYNHYFGLYQVDPDTGVGWTQAGANGIEVGFKLQASE